MEILHLDAACIVVVKPSGILCVPGRNQSPEACLSAHVQQRFADARVVHRLDMATSGLVLFARGAEAQRRLAGAFAAREVQKRYLAVVDGQVTAASGTIDLPLLADWPHRPRQKVDREHGKPALTHYRVLAREQRAGSPATRLELRPVTGRSHQLRVHLLALGHPVLGDALYAPPAVLQRAERLLLHAAGLQFPHPLTGMNVCFDAAAPF